MEKIDSIIQHWMNGAADREDLETLRMLFWLWHLAAGLPRCPVRVWLIGRMMDEWRQTDEVKLVRAEVWV